MKWRHDACSSAALNASGKCISFFNPLFVVLPARRSICLTPLLSLYAVFFYCCSFLFRLGGDVSQSSPLPALFCLSFHSPDASRERYSHVVLLFVFRARHFVSRLPQQSPRDKETGKERDAERQAAMSGIYKTTPYVAARGSCYKRVRVRLVYASVSTSAR